MLLLVLFAFLSGIITILSPCILPILPIVLSGSVGDGKRRPLGIITGFVLSFTFFTLFLTTIVQALNISAETLRNTSILVIFLAGLGIAIPKIAHQTEILFQKLTSKVPAQNQERHGFWGGLIIGLSIGLIWTPCVGPILSAVISLAISGSVSGGSFFITIAYALGTAIPMFAILIGGRSLLNKTPWLTRNTAKIQQVFGIIMMTIAVMMVFGLDRDFQTYILETFPQYSENLNVIEDNNIITEEIEKLNE